MLSSALAHAWLLALLGLACDVSAYDPSSGSIAAGDLSVAAPYGLPPSTFESDTNKPDEAATFNITGYDVSADSTPQSVDGWKLEAAVKGGVSLSDATNSSVNKDQVFGATTLYIQAPDNMKMDDSWKMCAVVYPGLASSVDSSTVVDGSCSGVLSTECVQALSVAAGGANSNGMDSNGNCTNFVLPARCTDTFPSDSIRTTAIGMLYLFTQLDAFPLLPSGPRTCLAQEPNIGLLAAINQTVLDDKRFYAYGSEPTDSANSTTAEDQARQNVWTVVTIFSHLSSSGTRSSTNIGVQCVRAINGTTDNVTSGASRPLPSLTTWVTNYKTSAFGAVLLAGYLMAM